MGSFVPAMYKILPFLYNLLGLSHANLKPCVSVKNVSVPANSSLTYSFILFLVLGASYSILSPFCLCLNI